MEKKEKVWEFTDSEKDILSLIDSKFKYIARDEDDIIMAHESKPEKDIEYWHSDKDFVSLEGFSRLFKSIRWEDDEPCEFRKYI